MPDIDVFGGNDFRCSSVPVFGLEDETGHYVVVYSCPLAEADAFRSSLRGLVSDMYEWEHMLPLIIVEATGEQMADVVTLPGVVKTYAALNSSLQSNFAAAFSHHMMTSVHQAHGGHIEGRFLAGGREEGPGYPALEELSAGRYRLVDDEDQTWSVRPAILGAVNVSMGPRSFRYPYLEHDLVNLSSRAASEQFVVVMAAGNCGERTTASTSAWSRSPWVISVGATEDEAGTRLLDISSRGTEDDPATWPDVVAWGQSLISGSPEHCATSYAAPKVARCAALALGVLLQLQHSVSVAQGLGGGVPAIGVGFIDHYGEDVLKEEIPSFNWPSIPALPIAGVGPEVGVLVADDKSKRWVLSDAWLSVRAVRQLIQAAARPIGGYERWHVGAGFLSASVLVDYLSRLTLRQLSEIVLADVPEGGPADDVLPFELESLRVLEALIPAMPVWGVDVRQGIATWPQQGDWGSIEFSIPT